MENYSELIKLLQENKVLEARKILLDMNSVDIAELYQEMDSETFAILFRILPKNVASEVFSYLDSDQQEYLVKLMSDEEVNDILSRVYMDDMVDFIEEMPANVVKKVLRNTPVDKRNKINALLSYPEDSAGSIMTTEYIGLKENWTVQRAINYVKEHGFDKETINILYVMSQERQLVGIVEIRNLLLNDYETKIRDIMDKNFVSVTTVQDQEEVAKMFKKYGYLAMPVVDKENRLVGIITVDDILQVIEEENEEDFSLMNALQPSEDEYLKSGVLTLAKQRIGWLVFLMISATFTGIIIQRYEDVLSSVVILASFIPMLMDTGGNAGSQSSTLIIRGLALNEIKFSDIFQIIFKELRVSFIVGVVLAFINYIRIYYFVGIPHEVAITVAISLVGIVVIAQVAGSVLPLIAKALHFDPALMAAPLVTTIVDTIALVIYFNVAQTFISTLH